VAETQDILGEGPVWSADDQRLYWFDIKGSRLNWLAPADGSRGAFALPARGSVAVPHIEGGLVLVTEAGLGRLDTGSGDFRLVRSLALPEGFRTNDGKIDVRGRIWWSTMDDDGGRRPGALHRTDPDGRTRRILDGLHIANTVSCNPEGDVLYLADSAAGVIWSCFMRPDGSLDERRPFVDLSGEPGAPDGSAVDEEGCLWNAQWGLSRVVRYRPDGSVERIIPLPVTQVTSCAFGGPGLSTLYITSAREGLDEAALVAQPLAGSLFALDAGVAGLDLPPFAGRLAP